MNGEEINKWAKKYYNIDFYDEKYLNRKYNDFLIMENQNSDNAKFQSLKNGIKKIILLKVVKDIKTEIAGPNGKMGEKDSEKFNKVSKITSDDIKDPSNFFGRMSNQYPKQVLKFKNRILSLSDEEQKRIAEEQKRLEEQKSLEEQRRLEEQTRIEEQERISERLLEEQLEEQKRLEEQPKTICNYKIDGKRSPKKRSNRKKRRSQNRTSPKKRSQNRKSPNKKRPQKKLSKKRRSQKKRRSRNKNVI